MNIANRLQISVYAPAVPAKNAGQALTKSITEKSLALFARCKKTPFLLVLLA
jgi:hypothetical protein